MSHGPVDARGRRFEPLQAPVRVVSLVPSLTELLFGLGLGEDEIAGRTRFCIHPAGRVEKIPEVGGTKSFDIAKVLALEPDLVIASMEENRKEAIDEIEAAHDPPLVYVIDPTSLDETVEVIRDIGVLIDRRDNARAVAERIDGLRSRLDPPQRGTALYMVWMGPYMCAAPGTFIHDMMRLSGYANASRHETGTRYPELTVRDIAAIGPDNILLASEPFPFGEQHVEALRQRLASVDREYAGRVSIRVVDGQHYSWYGSRTLIALEAFLVDTDR